MSRTQTKQAAKKPLFVVRRSKIHGNGVFAARKIPAETLLSEYVGERISWREANKREGHDPDNPYHTFYFALENGKVIDGGVGGNDLRWINHSCEPNCEAREDEGRVYIYTLRDIKRGEELYYDYGLVIDERHTPSLKKAYACLCNTESCRKTMLAPKRRKKAS